jgi:hypothetical protein
MGTAARPPVAKTSNRNLLFGTNQIGHWLRVHRVTGESKAIKVPPIQDRGTLAERVFGNIGFMAASGISGVASSASATVAAANLSASAKITTELAGTSTVIASMASALTNVPLVFRHLSGKVLFRIASFTALQIVVGIALLTIQHYFLSR